jgi:hypothetical protein
VNFENVAILDLSKKLYYVLLALLNLKEGNWKNFEDSRNKTTDFLFKKGKGSHLKWSFQQVSLLLFYNLFHTYSNLLIN